MDKCIYNGQNHSHEIETSLSLIKKATTAATTEHKKQQNKRKTRQRES